MSLITEIKEFVDLLKSSSFPRAIWFYSEEMNVYMRYQNHKTLRTGSDINTKTTLTVANVSVKEEFRNQKIYSNFLEELEKIPGIECIFIENVHDINHAPIYLSRGYIQQEYPGLVDSNFYKIL